MAHGSAGAGWTGRPGHQAEEARTGPGGYLAGAGAHAELEPLRRQVTRVVVLGSSAPSALLRAILSEDPRIEEAIAGDPGNPSSVAGGDIAVGPFDASTAQERAAAMECISAGVPYISSSAQPETVQALLALQGEAERSAVLVLTAMGWSPGISNLMAVQAASQLDRVTRVRVAWVASCSGPMGEMARYRGATLLSGEASVMEGSTVYREPAGPMGRGLKRVFFPEPLGWRELHLARGAEVLSLAGSFPGLEELMVTGGLTDPHRGARPSSSLAVRANGRAQGFGRLIAGAAGGWGPSRQPWSGVRVDVSGSRDGRPRQVTLGLVDQLPNLLTVPVLAAVLSLTQMHERPTGVMSPEELLDPERFFSYLSERGVRAASLERESEAHLQ